LMLDVVSKSFFHAAARSRSLKRLASRYGMARPSSFARRFIAGEEVDEAIETAARISARGMALTLDYLGESVANLAEADIATHEYLHIIEKMVAAGIERNISLKLTQLGLDVDPAICTDNLRRVLESAQLHGFFVRIDMENSPYVAPTIEIFETLWRQGYRDAGLVLQSALYRSENDLQRMNAIGARIRLVKGAYKEPKTVAHRRKADVDASFVRMMKALLTDGTYPAIATHDPTMIEATRRFAAEKRIALDRFEFQMLYGIRRDLQASLTAAGYKVRVYVPFGREWFPYFMRRLGERPANVMFVVRGVTAES
jgi:proline dehydrogenase